MSKPLVFHPGDWLGDPGLRLVSFEARALWFEMLLLMAFSERRGYLTLNGAAMPHAKLARLVGTTEGCVDDLVKQLEEERVFSRTDDGVIYNRRMAREATQPIVAPAPEVAGEQEQMPHGIPPVPYDRIVEAYHVALPQLTKVQKMTTARKASVRARWREAWEGVGKRKGWKSVDEGVAHFTKFFGYVARECPFLLGEEAGTRDGQRAFQADFEWLMKDGNFTKTCEGRYAREAAEKAAA